MKISQFAKHPLTITVLAGGALFVTLLIATPYLINIGIERWLLSHGPERAHAENVDFNPFTGRLSLDNLVVESASGRVFQIPHASVTFSWKQLLRKHIYIKELVLQDAFLLVDRFEQVGFRVGGLILRELAGATDKAVRPAWGRGISSRIRTSEPP